MFGCIGILEYCCCRITEFCWWCSIAFWLLNMFLYWCLLIFSSNQCFLCLCLFFWLLWFILVPDFPNDVIWAPAYIIWCICGGELVMGSMFRFMELGSRVSLGGQYPVASGCLSTAWRQVYRLFVIVLEQETSTGCGDRFKFPCWWWEMSYRLEFGAV